MQEGRGVRRIHIDLLFFFSVFETVKLLGNYHNIAKLINSSLSHSAYPVCHIPTICK